MKRKEIMLLELQDLGCVLELQELGSFLRFSLGVQYISNSACEPHLFSWEHLQPANLH